MDTTDYINYQAALRWQYLCLPLKVRFCSSRERMCEHSDISPAAALRESRRKKILENSENRLKFIERINSSPEKISTETFLDTKPEPEIRIRETVVKKIPSSDINPKFNDILKNHKELKEISDFLLQHHEVQEDEVGEELEEMMTGSIEQNKKNGFFKVFLHKRLHYVLLAIIVNILFFLNAGYFFYENIFCLFYTVKTMELLSGRNEKDFQPVLFFFIAGLPKSMQRSTKTVLTLLLALLSDLCLYLFTFIIGTKIINNLH